MRIGPVFKGTCFSFSFLFFSHAVLIIDFLFNWGTKISNEMGRVSTIMLCVKS